MPSEGIVYRSGRKQNNKRKSNISLAEQIARRRIETSSTVNHSARSGKSSKTISDLDSVDISHLTKLDDYKRTPTPLPTVNPGTEQRQNQSDRKPTKDDRDLSQGFQDKNRQQNMPHQKNEVKHILPPVQRHPGNYNNGQASRANQHVSLPPIQDNNKVTSRNSYREEPVNTRRDYSQPESKQNTKQSDKRQRSRSRSRSLDGQQRRNSRDKNRSRSNSQSKRKSNDHAVRKYRRSRSRSKEDRRKHSSRDEYQSKKKSRSRSRERNKSRDLKQNNKSQRSKSRERRKRSKSYDRKYKSQSREKNRSTSRNHRRRSKSKERMHRRKSSESRQRSESREDRNRRKSRNRSESRERRHRNDSRNDLRRSSSRDRNHRRRDDSHVKEKYRKRSMSRDKKVEHYKQEKISKRYRNESRSNSHERGKHAQRQWSASSSDGEINYKSRNESKHRRFKSKYGKLQGKESRKDSKMNSPERETNFRRNRQRRSHDDQYSDEYDSDDSDILLQNQNKYVVRQRHQMRKQNNLKLKSKGKSTRHYNESDGKYNVIILENGREYNSFSDEDDMSNQQTIYIRSKSQHTGRLPKNRSGSKDYYSDVDTRKRVIDKQVIYYHDVGAEDNLVANRDVLNVPRIVRTTNVVNAQPVVQTEPDELFYLVPASRKPNNNSQPDNLVYVNQSAERLVTVNNPTHQNNGQPPFRRNKNDVVYGQEPLYDEYRQPVQQKFFNQHTNHYRHNNLPTNINTTETNEDTPIYSKMELKIQNGIKQQNSENKITDELENMKINDFAKETSLDENQHIKCATPEESRSSQNDSSRSSVQSTATYAVSDSRMSNQTTPDSRISTADKRRALKHLGELSNYNIDMAMGKTPLTAPPMTDENLLKRIFNDEFQAQMDEYLRS